MMNHQFFQEFLNSSSSSTSTVTQTPHPLCAASTNALTHSLSESNLSFQNSIPQSNTSSAPNTPLSLSMNGTPHLQSCSSQTVCPVIVSISQKSHTPSPPPIQILNSPFLHSASPNLSAISSQLSGSSNNLNISSNGLNNNNLNNNNSTNSCSHCKNCNNNPTSTSTSLNNVNNNNNNNNNVNKNNPNVQPRKRHHLEPVVSNSGNKINYPEVVNGTEQCAPILQFKDNIVCNSALAYDCGQLIHNKEPFLEGDVLRIPLYSQTLYGEIQLSPIEEIDVDQILNNLILKFIVKHTTYEVERTIHANILKMIIDCSTSDTMSSDFFHLLTKQLCKVISAKFSAICYHIPDNKAITLSICNEGTILENIEYSLTGTPCGELKRTRKMINFQDVSTLFPNDSFLKDNNIYSFLGIPLFDSSRNLIGHICLLHDEALNPIIFDTSILYAVSTRASIEMERRKVIEELVLAETLLDQSPTCCLLLSKTGIIFRCFGQLKPIIGYRDIDISGHDISTLELNPEASEIKKVIESVLEQDKKITQEMVLKTSSGDLIQAEIFVKQIFDHYNNSLGIMVMIRDITESKQIQHSLETARDRALKAIQIKSQFMATISHEIRTPMNGVIGMAEMLLTTDLNPEQQEIAETIFRSGELLLSITSDILDFSKIEASKLELEMIEFDFVGCVEGLANTIALSAGNKPIEVILLFDHGVPTNLVGDPNRLGQIILNIGYNAIKYTERGHVYIHVSLLEREHSKCRIKISVEDSGIGIEESKRSMLFEPFTQLDASTTRKYGGSGLGLAIVSKLAKLMDGDVVLEKSEVGVGSTFTFTGVFEEIHSANPTFTWERLTIYPKSSVILIDSYEVGKNVLIKKMENLDNVRVKVVEEESLNKLFEYDKTNRLYQLPQDCMPFFDPCLKMVMLVHRFNRDINDFMQYAEMIQEFYKNTSVKVILCISVSLSKTLKNTGDKKYTIFTKPISTPNVSKLLHKNDDTFIQDTLANEKVFKLKRVQKPTTMKSPLRKSTSSMQIDSLISPPLPVLPQSISPKTKSPIFQSQQNPQQPQQPQLSLIPLPNDNNNNNIIHPPSMSPPPLKSPSQKPDLSSVPKILLVEDNAVNRKVVSLQLQKLGYTCDTAEDGYEGFKKYKEGDYDLIFMDLTMPVCDGVQSSLLIRSFEQINSKIKKVNIIGLSATCLHGSKEYCKTMGMNDFVVKPLKLKPLKQILDTYLQ
eukprot:gene5959-7422_t